MKDVIFCSKDNAYFSQDIHEKLYNNLLTSADRKKLETQDYIQILVSFEKLTPMKTLAQLGYLHAEVYFKAWLMYMITEGKMEEEEAIGRLKKDCGFAYASGVPKSMANAHIDDASKFIDRAVDFVNSSGVITCEKSKTWEEKVRKGIK